jgi:hypothetical protein
VAKFHVNDGGGSSNYLSFIGFTYVAFLMYCLNIAGLILQSQLAKLRAQQAAQEEAHWQQLAAQQEAHRRQLEVVQEHSARQMKEFVSFFQDLEIPGFRCPLLPPVIFAPPPVLAPPPVHSPLGTPVSFYQSIYCFCLCGHPAITNEIASPLCSNSRRV